MDRLDKIISAATGLTRKETRRAISGGLVEVNRIIEKKADRKVDVQTDMITLEGRNIGYKEHVYYLLNKPKGLLTASADRRRETVLDLFRSEPRYGKLFAVGRLDKDTTGLLLVTDDGDYAHKVISPKSRIEKEYRALVDAPLPPDAVQAFEKGIVLADGTQCLPARVREDEQDPRCVYITVFEGKYHQIKRMLGTLDMGVEELRRIRIAGLKVPDGLAEGEYVEISRENAMSVLN